MTNDPNTSRNPHEHDPRRDNADGAGRAPSLRDLPHRFGFSDTDSLVILGITDGAVTVVARHSASGLAEQSLPVVWDHWDAFLIDVGVGFDAVSLIGYCDPVHAAVLAAFRETAPLPVADVVLVTAGRWWRLDCPTPGTCTQPACHLIGAPLDTREDLSGGSDPDDPTDPATDDPTGPAGLMPVGHRSPMDAVAARLPCTPTGDAAVNQAVFRLLLDLQHTAYTDATNDTVRAPIPAMTAALLTGLDDPQVAEGCLAWTDLAARRMYLDLASVAPPRWSGPAWALLAATAYRHGHLPSFWVALDRALADQPHQPLARHLLACARADRTPHQVRAALAARLAEVPSRLHGAPAPADHPRHDL